MDGFSAFWNGADLVIRVVAAGLLAMSVAAWVLILWRGWWLRRVRVDLARAVPAFWAAPTLEDGRRALATLDRERTVLPLLDALLTESPAATLGAAGRDDAPRTRRLRDALHRVVGRLQSGQVVLASIGATAPFVGLFGTVWGIYHALAGLGGGGPMSIERVAGPVGEALVMTAAGIAVAIPAVLAYNVFGQRVGACETELEGYAHDLRELAGGDGRTTPAARPADA